MSSDIILNKIQTIERCIARINEVYNHNSNSLDDFTKQDSIILNIQRSCEASIDVAMHIISEKHLGIPQTSREAFEILFQANILTKETTQSMKNMVGFRNIAVHDYQTIQIEIVKEIIEKHLSDFTKYTSEIITLIK